MKIKVGEYCRVNEDVRFLAIGIGKIVRIDINEKYVYIEMKNKVLNALPMQIEIKNIVKHSKNIIDLIEEGDYVNGYKVVKSNLESKKHGKYVDVYCPSQNLKLEFLEHVFAEQIRTIVTKEQFAQMQYLVKE